MITKKNVFNFFSCLAGLGDHQDSANKNGYLPGGQHEPSTAFWIPAQEEDAGAEKRTQFKKN